MSPAPERFVLDTNIFVYTFDSGSASKRARAKERMSCSADTRLGVISFRVIQEFFNVATRTFAKPMRAPEAQLFEDSLMISSAIAADCRILWTEDLQHRQRIRNLEIRNLFTH